MPSPPARSPLPFAPSAKMPSHFSLLPATPADTPEMREIYFAAFQDNPGNTFWWSPDKQDMLSWLETRILRKFADPSVRHYKIVDDESGEIAAFARWDIPEGKERGFGFGHVVADAGAQKVVGAGDVIKSDEEEGGGSGMGTPLTVSEAPGPKEVNVPASNQIDPPVGADPELCRDFFSKLAVYSKKWEASKKLGLSLIATSPAYQRRGAARALIEPLLAVADEQGLQTYLEATPTGKPVYEKLGFRQVDTIDFDLKTITKGKLDAPYQLCIMVREPTGKTELGLGR